MAVIRRIVIDAKGAPNHNGYVIRGEDGNEYFAHAGDLHVNEQRIYHDPLPNSNFENGDEVEFDVQDEEDLRPCVIHVKKIEH